MAAHPGRGAARAPPRARGSCRPRPQFRDCRGDRGAAGGGRAQYRSFPDRPGDVFRPCRCRESDAGGDRPGSRMIIGIGSDLVDVRRIERTIERHGERFLARIFTATERAKAESRVRSAETYAKRFAAKEACAKALGTGLRAGVFWRDIGVVNLPSGRPTMTLTGGGPARLQFTTAAGRTSRVEWIHHHVRSLGPDPVVVSG